MPRIARIVISGVPHHITQRGNNRQTVFLNDDDRLAYLAHLSTQSRRFGLSILGYCLMSNHIHLIATPFRESSLAFALGRAHYLYTLHFNKTHGRSGHLWQNRFFSCALDERHCYSALRYAELNPVRARMVRSASAYRWSSAAAHCGGTDDSGVLDLADWRAKWDEPMWRAELSTALSADEVRAMRQSTHTGRPLGSEDFLFKIEKLLGFRVHALPRGRPKSLLAPEIKQDKLMFGE